MQTVQKFFFTTQPQNPELAKVSSLSPLCLSVTSNKLLELKPEISKYDEQSLSPYLDADAIEYVDVKTEHDMEADNSNLVETAICAPGDVYADAIEYVDVKTEHDMEENNSNLVETAICAPVDVHQTEYNNHWLQDLRTTTESEKVAIKEERRNTLMGELIGYAGNLDDAEIIANQIIDENIINAYTKVTMSSGKVDNLAIIVLKAKNTKVADIIEPQKGNDTAIVQQNYIFDAKYITSLRGGETYAIVYDYSTIMQLLPHLRTRVISKKMMLKALAQNVVVADLTSQEIVAVEKSMQEHDIVGVKNTFKADIAAARRKFKAKPVSSVVNTYTEQALQIMQDYAILNNHGQVKIIDTTQKNLSISSKADLKILFSKEEVLRANPSTGKLIMVNPVDEWLRNKNRREFTGLVFDPSEGDNGEAYNLFKGYKYEAHPLIDIALFKSFVKEVICSGQEEMCNIVWTFLAQMIQKPTKKMGTALVLLSAKGTGKSSFVYVLGKLMDGYFMQTAENKRLLGEFNNHLASTLLFYANELTFLDNKRVVSKLKNVITETEFTYELKGGATFTGPNYTRLIIDSNDDAAVSQTSDERRFIYPRISEARIGDTAYFNELYTLFEKPGFYESLMFYLMNFDYTEWEHFLKTPPKNEVTAEQQIENFMEVESWWHNCLDEGTLYGAYYEVQYDGKIKIANESLYNSFVKYTRANGRRVTLNSLQFSKAFRKYALGDGLCLEVKGKMKINGESKNSNVYESLMKCRDSFANAKKINNFEYGNTEWRESTVSA